MFCRNSTSIHVSQNDVANRTISSSEVVAVVVLVTVSLALAAATSLAVVCLPPPGVDRVLPAPPPPPFLAGVNALTILSPREDSMTMYTQMDEWVGRESVHS